MSTKPTAVEYEKRLGVVFEMLVRGSVRSEVLKYTAEHFDMRRSATDYMIHQAYLRFEEEANEKRSLEYGRAVGRLNKLFKMAIDAGQVHNALNVQKELNKLLRLEQTSEESQVADIEFL